MSATWNQLPGTLNLAAVRGDEFAAVVDFSIDMTGYTVSASITSIVTRQSVDTFATTFVSAAAGTVNLALTESQTAALPRGTYGWNLTWVAPGVSTRTALSGTLELK